MSKRINWSKSNFEMRARKVGREHHDTSFIQPVSGPVPKWQQTPASAGKVVSQPKTAKKKKSSPEQDAIRRSHYIQEVITSLANGKDPPRPFKHLDAETKEAIQTAGGPEKWVRRQPEYRRRAFAAQTVAKAQEQDGGSKLTTSQLLMEAQRALTAAKKELASLDKEKKTLEARLIEIEKEKKRIDQAVLSKQNLLKAIKLTK